MDDVLDALRAMGDENRMRMLLALVVGVALTFLLDYLDTSVRDKAELEAMDIAVLAEIPKK